MVAARGFEWRQTTVAAQGDSGGLGRPALGALRGAGAAGERRRGERRRWRGRALETERRRNRERRVERPF
jgi:hypothetical protein